MNCLCVSTRSDDVLLLLSTKISSTDPLQCAVRPVDFAYRRTKTTATSHPSISF